MIPCLFDFAPSRKAPSGVLPVHRSSLHPGDWEYRSAAFPGSSLAVKLLELEKLKSNRKFTIEKL
jgi:hypothetical protein